MARILTVDDDTDCLTILRNLLQLKDHEVLPLPRGEQAVQAAKELEPDLVITDLMMPGVTGGIVYHGIRKEVGPYMPIIVSSGSNLRMKLPEDPLLEFCPKPVDPDVLLDLIDQMIAKSHVMKSSGAAESDAAPEG